MATGWCPEVAIPAMKRTAVPLRSRRRKIVRGGLFENVEPVPRASLRDADDVLSSREFDESHPLS